MEANDRAPSRLSRGRGPLASAFVALSLVALLVVPLLVQRSVRPLREDIQLAADPARTLVTEVQYRLARQTSSLRGFLITRDARYLRQFWESAAREEQAYRALEPLARRLGHETLTSFVTLRTLSQQWHEALADEIDATSILPSAAGEVPFEQERYLAALAAAGELDQALLRATSERQGAIRAAERRMMAIQMVLVALALAAVLITAQLGVRVERLAEAAEARRQEAERALEDTARAVEAKARLMRGITHDIKNPLGAADGYAELLELGLKGELTPQQTEVIAGIRRSIRGALGILADLLELSRAETGELAIHQAPTSLAMVVRDAVDEYQGTARTTGHELRLSVPEEPVMANTDDGRVRQILGNLLSNAIKYTPPPGRISVEVRLERDGDGTEWPVVRVTDTGRGIPPQDRERVFEEFSRLSSDGVPGHGLGLAISRRLARLLGGELSLRSEVGEGSTFQLRLPPHPSRGTGSRER